MAKHLAKLAERLPKLYGFTPKSYQLPEETADFLADAKAVRKGKAWIIKPDAGCQGRGIVLVQKAKQIEQVCPLPAGTSSIDRPSCTGDHDCMKISMCTLYLYFTCTPAHSIHAETYA